MGGSGGSSFFPGDKEPESIAEKIRRSQQDAHDEGFENDLSELFRDLLKTFNDRDQDAVSARIDQILAELGKESDDYIKTLFGGSVAKHTYVDGLSDVDCLLLIDNNQDATPAEIIQSTATSIQNSIQDAEVKTGQLAVTVDYADGMSIQFIPAIKLGDLVKIPDALNNTWSNIRPQAFQQALTKANQQCAQKLVPTIKIVKAINAALPATTQLTGYHIESLAIEVFKGYEGTMSTTSMTQHFFQSAPDYVKSPIKDKTGQSVHVDDYLGQESSADRQTRAEVLQRVGRRIQNANHNKSIGRWKTLFDLE